MAEEITPQDAAYSDEEFGSEHESDGGYEEFADEDAEIQERPVEADTEDAGEYDAEFDEDASVAIAAGPPPSETAESPVERLPTDADDDSQEDAEPYDGEFDEDTPVVDAGPPTEEKSAAAIEQTPSTTDMTQNEVLVDKTSPEAGTLAIHDQTDAVSDSEAEYSVDVEHEAAPTLPENTNLPRNFSEERLSLRRSSVPSSVISRVTEDFSPKARFVRAGSMPLVLSAPVDKWMDSIPQDLSPERQDRTRKQSACFPVLEETQPQNLVDEENNPDDAENDVAFNNAAPVPNAASSRARAQSSRDLQREKVAVPVRRTRSLLYTGSLPCVEEVHPSEEIADPPHSQEDDDADSDDIGSYGEASGEDFESDHEDEKTQQMLVERPKSGPSTILYEVPDHEITPTSNNVEFTGDNDSYSSAVQTPDRVPTPARLDPPQSKVNDDDYADEMEDEFASDSEAPQFEGETTPHRSSDETSDYDVDEFTEDGRRETETLLQEARTLLELQQKESEPHAPASEQQRVSPETQAGNTEEDATEPLTTNEVKMEGEQIATMYDNDDEFDTDTPRQATPEQDTGVEHDAIEQYEFDNEDLEPQDSVLPQDDIQAPVEIVDKVVDSEKFDTEVQESAKDVESLPREAASAGNIATKMKSEASTPAAPTEQPALDRTETKDVKVDASPAQPSEVSLPLATAVVEKEEKQAPTSPIQPRQRELGQAATRPTRPVKNASLAAAATVTQSSPPVKPSRPATNRTPSAPSHKKPTTTPRSSRTMLRPSMQDHQVSSTNPAGSPAAGTNSSETTAPIDHDQSPRKQESPSKPRSKVSSPRSPSKISSGSYQYLPNEYPQLPRKEPVPRQKVVSKPSTSGDHGGKRRLLQPVRTPANLRFDLPKMDKTKRDWLFVNMFRHGDDLSKYESFVPPTLRARPPTSSSLKKTKKRPLSARGQSQASRFVSPSRRLVHQPNPELQDRERNWVPTTPHDSKLPPYDSILDKYCTTVTSPVIQRQIYQTRHRDLSPQLAFVLEKRVEKHCRKGFYDSFGGVSSSYKTEIVPTSPGDGSRQRQMSPRSPTKSGMLATAVPE
ncbi:hypothetical protein PF008_g4516 [Phytophthora fragariae]|uniref:Uncharacterized protein n=1 Tax=Phytophthora fragariae TaxID=53985 RepID=A0A6G0SCZ7_9STRA|nr:hypothetical protein PF008_g4516 [Phytophthora fragariae]